MANLTACSISSPFHKLRRLSPLLLLVVAARPSNAASATNMLGFTAPHAVDERALEKKFDSQINPDDQRAWLERMSSEPNHVGSPHDKQNAEFILEKFKEWG